MSGPMDRQSDHASRRAKLAKRGGAICMSMKKFGGDIQMAIDSFLTFDKSNDLKLIRIAAKTGLDVPRDPLKVQRLGKQSLYEEPEEIVDRYYSSGFDIIEEMKKRSDDLLWVRARAIDANVVNENGDFFPDEEFTKEQQKSKGENDDKIPAFKTFEGCRVYTNHKNDDVEKAKGEVVFAEYDEDEKCIWCTFFVDAAAYPQLARGIREGYITDVSMGCQVQWSTCSVCENKAESEKAWCDHLKNHKGKRWSGKIDAGKRKGQKVNSELVYEINHDIKFIELSVVGDGAFKNCEIEAVLPHNEVISYALDVRSQAENLEGMVEKGLSVSGEKDMSDTVLDIEKHTALRDSQDIFRTAVKLSNRVMERNAQGSWPQSSNVLDTLTAVLNKLEAVVVNLLSRKDNVDLKHVQNISKAMAEIQQQMSDMIDDGLGQEPTMGPMPQPMPSASGGSEAPYQTGMPTGETPAPEYATPGDVGSMMAPQGFAVQPAAEMSSKPFQISQMPNLIPGAIGASNEIGDDDLRVFANQLKRLAQMERAVDAINASDESLGVEDQGGQFEMSKSNIHDYTATNLMRRMAAKVRQKTEVETDDGRHRIVICSDGSIDAYQDNKKTGWNALARIGGDDIEDIRQERVHIVAQKLLDQFVDDASNGKVIVATADLPKNSPNDVQEHQLEGKRAGNPTEVQEHQIEDERAGNPTEVQEHQIEGERAGNPTEVQEHQIEGERAGNPTEVQEHQIEDARKGTDNRVTEHRLENRRASASPDRIVSATLGGLGYAVCDSFTSPSDILDSVAKFANAAENYAPKIVAASNDNAYRSRRASREQVEFELREPVANSVEASIISRLADVLVEDEDVEVEDIIDVLKTIASESADRMRTIIGKRAKEAASEMGTLPAKLSSTPDRSQSIRGALYAALAKDSDTKLDVQSVEAAIQAVAEAAFATKLTPRDLFASLAEMDDGATVAMIETARSEDAVAARQKQRESRAWWAEIGMVKEAAPDETSARVNDLLVDLLADKSIVANTSSAKIWKAAKKLSEGKRAAHELVTRAVALRIDGNMGRNAVDMTDKTETTRTIHLTAEDIGNVDPANEGFEDAVRDTVMAFLQGRGYHVDPGTFSVTELDVAPDGYITATIKNSVEKRLSDDHGVAPKAVNPEVAPQSGLGVDLEVQPVSNIIPEDAMAVGFEEGFGPEIPLMTPLAKEVRKNRREAMVRAAQGMPPAGGPPMPPAGGEMPPPPGGEGAPGLSNLTGIEDIMGESPETDLDSMATPGDVKPVGTICPSCGSMNVELAGGEGECGDCGTSYKVRLVIDNIVVPETGKATAAPGETGTGGEEEGLGALTAPPMGPEMGAPPMGGAPQMGAPPMGMGAGMPMAASIQWYSGPEQFVKVAEMKESGLSNAEIPGPKPAGMMCIFCGNNEVKTVNGRCHCTECGTISTASVTRSKKHPDYLLNDVKVLLPDVTAGKIKGPGIPDGTGPRGGTPLCPINPGNDEESDGKIKEPGIPDGTGPWGGTPLCPIDPGNDEESDDDKETDDDKTDKTDKDDAKKKKKDKKKKEDDD